MFHKKQEKIDFEMSFVVQYETQCDKNREMIIIVFIGSANLTWHALRKQAYSNILKILPAKNENFQIKILLFFILLLKT